MFKVKVIEKKALPINERVEYVEFATREEAVAYAQPYWNDSRDYMAILEDYSLYAQASLLDLTYPQKSGTPTVIKTLQLIYD